MTNMHLVNALIGKMDDDAGPENDTVDKMLKLTEGRTHVLVDNMVASITDFRNAAIVAIETVTMMDSLLIIPIDKYILRRLRKSPVPATLVQFATAMAILLEPYNSPDEDMYDCVRLENEEYRTVYIMGAIGVYNRLMNDGCWDKYLECSLYYSMSSNINSLGTL
jgi:hypothetical protein